MVTIFVTPGVEKLLHESAPLPLVFATAKLLEGVYEAVPFLQEAFRVGENVQLGVDLSPEDFAAGFPLLKVRVLLSPAWEGDPAVALQNFDTAWEAHGWQRTHRLFIVFAYAIPPQVATAGPCTGRQVASEE